MSSNDLYIVLVVLIGANVVLIALAGARSLLRRRRTGAAGGAGGAMTTIQGTGALALSPSVVHRGPLGPAMPDPEPALRSTDRLTGLLNPIEWSRLVDDENTRHSRYKRSATVVMIELDGLDRLVAALGQPAADRVIAAVAGTIHGHARKSDHVARLGPSRFGVLLPETNEVAAINYVERVRQASDLWLESGAIALRLAIGWASPVVDSSLVDAQARRPSGCSPRCTEPGSGTARRTRGRNRCAGFNGAPSTA